MPTKKIKQATLNTPIGINLFRGATTINQVNKLLRNYRIDLHPNRYHTEHTKAKATKKTYNLVMAANRRIDELRGRSGAWSYTPSRTSTAGGGRNIVPRRSRQHQLAYNLRLPA